MVPLGAGLGAGDHEHPLREMGVGRPHLLAVDHPLAVLEHEPWSARWRGRSRRSARSSPAPRAPRRRRSSAGSAAFCSSVPNAIRVGPSSSSPRWLTRAGASARAYSSWKITCCHRLSPRPPYSFGQPTQVQPCSASSRFHSSRSSNRLVVAAGTAETAQLGPLAGQVLAQPAPDLCAEGLVLGRVAQVHRCYPTKQLLGWEELGAGDDPGAPREAAERSATTPAYVERRTPSPTPTCSPRARPPRAATSRTGSARRPGRALGSQQHRLGRRRPRRHLRRRHAGPCQLPLHRPRGRRPRRAHRRQAGRRRRRVPRPHPDRRPAPQRSGLDRQRGRPRGRRPLTTPRPRRRRPSPSRSPDDVADILFTSGTTGPLEGRDVGPSADHRRRPGVGRARRRPPTTATSWSTRSSTPSATRSASSSAC